MVVLILPPRKFSPDILKAHHRLLYLPPPLQGPLAYNMQPYNSIHASYPSYKGPAYVLPNSYSYGASSYYPNSVSTNSSIASSYHDNYSNNSSASYKSNKDKEKRHGIKKNLSIVNRGTKSKLALGISSILLKGIIKK